MTREEISRVLDAAAPLEDGLDEIAERSKDAHDEAQEKSFPQRKAEPHRSHQQDDSDGPRKPPGGTFTGLMRTDSRRQGRVSHGPPSEIGKGVARPGPEHDGPEECLSEGHAAPDRHLMDRTRQFPEQDEMSKRQPDIQDGQTRKSRVFRPFSL